MSVMVFGQTGITMRKNQKLYEGYFPHLLKPGKKVMFGMNETFFTIIHDESLCAFFS